MRDLDLVYHFQSSLFLRHDTICVSTFHLPHFHLPPFFMLPGALIDPLDENLIGPLHLGIGIWLVWFLDLKQSSQDIECLHDAGRSESDMEFFAFDVYGDETEFVGALPVHVKPVVGERSTYPPKSVDLSGVLERYFCDVGQEDQFRGRQGEVVSTDLDVGCRDGHVLIGIQLRKGHPNQNYAVYASIYSDWDLSMHYRLHHTYFAIIT